MVGIIRELQTLFQVARGVTDPQAAAERWSKDFERAEAERQRIIREAAAAAADDDMIPSIAPPAAQEAYDRIMAPWAEYAVLHFQCPLWRSSGWRAGAGFGK